MLSHIEQIKFRILFQTVYFFTFCFSYKVYAIIFLNFQIFQQYCTLTSKRLCSVKSSCTSYNKYTLKYEVWKNVKWFVKYMW